ncbi:MAG: hypothetical protein ACUZ8H_15990 [Candidatus Anammoxibacter sp.]
MAWYDFNNDAETTKEYLAKVKYDKIVCRQASSFMEIVGSELKKNTQYRIITEKGFNAISVIEYLSNKHKLKEVYIAVYRMNQRAVYKLKEFIDGNDLKCKIVLSSFFRENKKYEKWCNDLISYAKGNENVKVSFAWNHAKVFLAKTEDNKYIVFEGSGNLSDNARIEQYIIEDNKTTYMFHKKWIEEI